MWISLIFLVCLVLGDLGIISVLEPSVTCTVCSSPVQVELLTPLPLIYRLDDVPLYCLIAEQGNESTVLYNVTALPVGLADLSSLKPFRFVKCNLSNQVLPSTFVTYTIYQGDQPMTVPSPAQRVLEIPMRDSPLFLGSSLVRIFDKIFPACDDGICVCAIRKISDKSIVFAKISVLGDCRLPESLPLPPPP